MSRVLAKAVVDVLRAPTPKGLGQYRVEVWGKDPHDYARVYTIDEKSDTLAAQEGLRRFVEEIEALIAKEH